jgi:hypothetical protein
MNLNNLKPAWRQFRLINAMQPIDQEEILLIIERAERQLPGRLPRFVVNTVVFIVLIVCCQAG